MTPPAVLPLDGTVGAKLVERQERAADSADHARTLATCWNSMWAVMPRSRVPVAWTSLTPASMPSAAANNGAHYLIVSAAALHTAAS